MGSLPNYQKMMERILPDVQRIHREAMKSVLPDVQSIYKNPINTDPWRNVFQMVGRPSVLDSVLADTRLDVNALFRGFDAQSTISKVLGATGKTAAGADALRATMRSINDRWTDVLGTTFAAVKWLEEHDITVPDATAAEAKATAALIHESAASSSDPENFLLQLLKDPTVTVGSLLFILLTLATVTVPYEEAENTLNNFAQLILTVMHMRIALIWMTRKSDQ